MQALFLIFLYFFEHFEDHDDFLNRMNLHFQRSLGRTSRNRRTVTQDFLVVNQFDFWHLR